MKNYGVLKGIAVQYKRDNDADPHSELLMSAEGVSFRVAINVRSSRGPVQKRLIEYLIMHDIEHPIVDRARDLPEGWNNLKDGVGDGAAIDYIRSNIFRATDMKPITHLAPGPNNDLFEYVEDLLQRAISEDGAVVYTFGERWGPEEVGKDDYFHFLPGVVSPNRRNLSSSSKLAATPIQSPPKWPPSQSDAACHGMRSAQGNAGASTPLVRFS